MTEAKKFEKWARGFSEEVSRALLDGEVYKAVWCAGYVYGKRRKKTQDSLISTQRGDRKQ